ncbi:MAG TPA: tryptophan--tRNA ligase [Candidatus Paceibacterota bacterium]
MAEGKKVLLSGMKPTGRPHIGNYFGAMKQFVDLVGQFDPHYIMVADYHALNLIQNASDMRTFTHEMVLDYLAIGLDPDRVVFFKQSDVSEHTELAWIFDTITTMPYLMRAHAYKDAEAKNKEISVGTFNYPMLMAADILLYDANIVPVGQDQKQHVEYARDTAQKFNHIFGEVFVMPESLIMSEVATVLGIDGRKMSKSYGNHIPLFATDEEIYKQVMSIVTDSKGVEEAKDPEKDNVFALHKLFSTQDLPALEKRYREGGIGYKESKELLAENIIKYISPMRTQREELTKQDGLVERVLEEGARKAKVKASETMLKVRRAIGVR